MKSFLLRIVFIISLFLQTPALADVMPLYSGAINKETIGFLQVPKKFNIYAYPRLDATVLDVATVERFDISFKKYSIDPQEMYVVQLGDKGYEFCMVVDVQDDWYKILYDKTNNKFGWVKPQSNSDFYSLREFYSLYGKKDGLYYMKNVDYRKRGVYSGAYQASQKIDGLTLVKSIKLHKISGNWALVTIVDIDSKPKIGYIRWREDDGTILLFPKLDRYK